MCGAIATFIILPTRERERSLCIGSWCSTSGLQEGIVESNLNFTLFYFTHKCFPQVN